MVKNDPLSAHHSGHLLTEWQMPAGKLSARFECEAPLKGEQHLEKLPLIILCCVRQLMLKRDLP